MVLEYNSVGDHRRKNLGPQPRRSSLPAEPARCQGVEARLIQKPTVSARGVWLDIIARWMQGRREKFHRDRCTLLLGEPLPARAAADRWPPASTSPSADASRQAWSGGQDRLPDCFARWDRTPGRTALPARLPVWPIHFSANSFW